MLVVIKYYFQNNLVHKQYFLINGSKINCSHLILVKGLRFFELLNVVHILFLLFLMVPSGHEWRDLFVESFLRPVEKYIIHICQHFSILVFI